MECRQCNRPIFESIEGELICERCWTINEQDDDSKACDLAIDEYLKEQRQEEEALRRVYTEANRQWQESTPLREKNLCFVCEEPMNNSPVGHKCWYLEWAWSTHVTR